MTTAPSSRRRPRLALAVIAPTALALALGVGYAVGRSDPGADGGGATDPGPDAADPSPVSAALAPARSCDALLASYVRRGEEAVTAYGWDLGVVDLAGRALRDADAEAPTAQRAYAAPRPTRATSSDTGTNVQEAGVDEADVVKTDGERLVRVVQDTLEVHDLSGRQPELVGELTLDEVRGAELLLDGDRAVVVGRDRVSRHRQRVLVVDLADLGDPRVVSSRVWGGALLSARLHTSQDAAESVVRLVVAPELPDLDFVRPGRRRSWREAERINRRVVRRSSIEDWLPRRDGEPALDCGDVEVPADPDAPLGTVAVTAFTVEQPDEATVTAIAAGATTAYSSPDRLFLADASPQWGWAMPAVGPAARIAMPLPEDDGVAQIHSLALDGLETTHAASGEVEGAIADRWSMDAVDGVLRVAVGPTRRTTDANAVVTLRERDGELVEAGRVDGLGRREEIKSVRWSDDLAIVVTFRQMDPLYTIDLSDPAQPELIGELKIPGFSDYLHPLGPRRMIGIGQATGRWGMGVGAQAALFKVRDLTDPERLDVIDWPRRSTAGASADPRQFTWLPEQRIGLAVVSQGWRGRRGWVSVLRVEPRGLSSDLIEVEDGVEVADVRTVPLPSGQVVLVTRDEVSFLDLGPAPR